MTQLQRFKFLVLPFALWTFIGFFGVISLRWFLEYYIKATQLNQTIWDFWIPFGTAVLIWFLVLRVRFKMFYKSHWKNNQESFIFMGINVFMALVIIFGEFSLEYAQLQKQSISTIEEINASDWNTCYSIDKLNWNNQSIHGYNVSEVTGRFGNTLNYYAYFVAPINEHEYPDTLFWIGKKYRISFSNGESESHKDSRWKSFYTESLNAFLHLKKGTEEFLMPVQKSGNLNGYTSAIERTFKYQNSEHRVFEFSSKNLYSEAFEKFMWSGIFFILGIGVCYAVSFLTIADKRAYSQYIEGKYTITPGEREVRDILFMRKNIKVMPILSYLIILLYLISCSRDGNLFNIQPSTCFDYGAMQKLAFDNGDYWRMISAMFLHGGFLHLFNNLFFFVVFGLLLEPFLGHWRFLLLVLFVGFGGEIVSYFYIPDETITLGASGIVFGLFGWYVLASILYKSLKDIKGFLIFLALGMIISFFYGLISSNVNNAAHIGGFLTGLVLAFIIQPEKIH